MNYQVCYNTLPFVAASTIMRRGTSELHGVGMKTSTIHERGGRGLAYSVQVLPLVSILGKIMAD